MEQILMELKDITGVIGVYIYHSGKGVVIKNVPAVFRNPILAKIGRTLTKIYSAGNIGFTDLAEASLFYKESIVIIREIREKYFLVVLFEPDAKLNMLMMALNLVMNELAEAVENTSVEAPVQTMIARDNRPEKVNDKKLLPDDLLNAGPMADSLQGMQKALIKVMGPIAKIIFTDALMEWIEQDQPDVSTLSNLVRILGKEINDPEKFNIYQQRIGQYIWIDN